MSNAKKSETLGMPHGTAAHRLRKNILFHLLNKYGENVCVRCGQIIQTVEDLSVEHIKPWEGISADLFWDLNNIAFSHLSCNRPHSYPGVANPFWLREANPSRYGSAPAGTAWCAGHKLYLETSLFHPNSRNPSGHASYCKECRRNRKD